MLTRTGLFKKALQVIKQVPRESDKASLLNNIAEALCEAEKLEDALIVVNMINDDSHKAAILANIAKSFVKTGNECQAVRFFENALTSTKLIEKDRTRVTTLANIGRIYIQTWNNSVDPIKILYQALKMAEGIEDVEDRAYALKDVAQAFIDRGNPSQGVSILNSAINTTEHISGKEAKRFLLSMIAEMLCQIGEYNKAAVVAEQALTLIEDENDAQSDPFSQTTDRFMRGFREIFALKRSAYVLVLAGGKTGLERTLHAIPPIESVRESSHILAGAAEALIKMNAQQELDHVFSFINKMPDKGNQVGILRQLFGDFLDAGQPEQAYQTLLSALIAARLDGRDSVLMTLRDGAKILVTLDEGQILWRVYESIRELESWWRT